MATEVIAQAPATAPKRRVRIVSQKKVTQAEAPAEVPAPVEEKPKRRKVVKKEPVKEEPEPETEEPETEGPGSEETESDKTPLEEQFDQVKDLLSGALARVREEHANLKALEKEFAKLSVLYKKEQKTFSKRRKSNKGSQNHGFQKEVGISDELADFLGVAHGTTMRRPEVTRLVNRYANANNLKDPNNGSIYLPDEKLAKLFGPATLPIRKQKEGETETPALGYSILNFQSYMKRHFIKL